MVNMTTLLVKSDVASKKKVEALFAKHGPALVEALRTTMGHLRIGSKYPTEQALYDHCMQLLVQIEQEAGG